MATNLKQYFPMIREQAEIMGEIQSNPGLLLMFNSWTKNQQKEFLDFMTGAKGVKMLYDPFFKEILNPEYTPERINKFLSLLMKEKIKVLKVLPNDSTRLIDEASLLINDIVVEMEDGSIANLECQKIGYHFPGQRSACYSADLLLRQYKRVKGERNNRGKKFSYRNIKKVYTIVLFEQSTKEFHKVPDKYVHRVRYKADTNLELEMLQEFIFVPLDIFLKHLHNRGISNQLDAWLAFLSTDEAEIVAELYNNYPEFRGMYEDVYGLCQNIEKVMEMFSKELMELDRNTVQYMIDEMQDTIDSQKDMIDSQKDTIDSQQNKLAEHEETIDVQQDKLLRHEETIKSQQGKLAEQENMIQQLLQEVERLKTKASK